MIWQWLWDKKPEHDDGNSWWLDFITAFWFAIGLGSICVFGYILFMAFSVLFSVVAPASEIGIASVYTHAESGKWRYRTASGEIMRDDGMTAAHRTLPLGTRVIVHHGKRAATVRINDRGPWRKRRIIDLSPAAARAVHLPGLGKVTLEIAQ